MQSAQYYRHSSFDTSFFLLLRCFFSLWHFFMSLQLNVHSTKLLLTFDYIIVIFDICKVNCWYFAKAEFLLSKRVATLRPNLNLHAIIEIYIFKLTMFVRSIFELGKCSWMFVDEFNNIKVEIYAAETHECFACEFLGRTCNVPKVVHENIRKLFSRSESSRRIA